MWRNYVTIAYRSILKNRIFAAVNILGLAIGMAACFLIYLYIHFELSYDRFHKNAANLYRVTITFTGSLANTGSEATNHPALGPTMKAEFPEVVDYARVVPASLFLGSSMLSYTNGNKTNAFNEDRMFMADSSFLTIFSFPLVQGNPATALSEANSIVISEATARKYFGNQDPMGRTLHVNRLLSFKVSGVFKDVPENSHIKFDVLVSFKLLGGFNASAGWTWPEFYTYVLLAPGADPGKIEARFPAFIQRHFGDKLKELNYGCAFHMQPITDIHLKSHYLNEFEANGSEREIYFLSIIGLFILVIAWINYINLSTAKSAERAKEVGLRKVVGAAKSQLVGQFMFESVMLNLVAVIVAVGLVWIGFPLLNHLIGKDLSSEFSATGPFYQPLFWASVVSVFLAGALLVGAYPAFILSSFRPVLVLKGRLLQSPKGIWLRKTLVSFQFVLSILLIGATITVFSQLSFMRHQDLGYNKDQILVLKAPAIYDSTGAGKFSAIKTELMAGADISSVSVSSEVPGKSIGERNSVRKENEDQTHNFTPFYMEVDDQFVPTYQMQLAAGRNFYPGESTAVFDSVGVARDIPDTRVLVNESTVKGLGYKNDEQAINQGIFFRLGQQEVKGHIIGVIKDYHQRSLRDPYDPVLYYYPTKTVWNYISIRLHTAHLDRDLSSIEKTYRSVFAGSAFDYFFLDEYFDAQYRADQRFGSIFSVFTGFAILVACLGLLGLSSYVIKLRTKEIGIRKVLGASVYSLLVLFSGDFVKLVCLSSLIALPIIYVVSDKWLNNYAFHIHLGWTMFALPPLLLLALSLVTVSLQSIKTALANPIKSLRTD